MSDKPILFSRPMIKAILGGRKTQTRRIAKGIDLASNGTFHIHSAGGGCAGVTEAEVPLIAPDYMRWAVGDQLWVREAWKAHSTFEGTPPRDIPPTNIFYLADDKYSPSGSRGRPGIHMPRWASRLTLAVTDVRVQRLQDINRDDVIAEGITERDGYPITDCWAGWHEPYAQLWDQINGAGSWEANPWIVALTFTVERRNIDAASPSPKENGNG